MYGMAIIEFLNLFFLNLSNHCIWYTNYVKCQSYKMNIYLGWCHKKVVNYTTCPFWKNYFLVQNIIIWWRTFLPPPAQFRFFIVIPNLNLKWHQFKFWSCDNNICDVHFTKWLWDISSKCSYHAHPSIFIIKYFYLFFTNIYTIYCTYMGFKAGKKIQRFLC